MTLKTITVYASSSDRVDDIYKKAGFDLGVAIAREGWQQVNGGGSTGLMRSASDGALSVGGAVKVVILRHFAEKGYLHPEVEDVVYQENMPGRKKGLYELGDAFICLPGGLGTFEELMEVLSWRQLGFHKKALALLNVDGYYDPIHQMIQLSIDRGFVAPGFGSSYLLSDDIGEIVDWLKSYEPEEFSIDSKV
jgi:uncharacterized protein (TIGR00730 family)